MSFFPGKDPAPAMRAPPTAIDFVLVPRSVDGQGFRRAPRPCHNVKRAWSAPFQLIRHVGPRSFRRPGIDVRPHPHIGLATVTFLFEARILHRDRPRTPRIRPGEVKWRPRAAAIVHSSAPRPIHSVDGEPIQGLPCWVAMPAAQGEKRAGFIAPRQRGTAVISDEGKTRAGGGGPPRGSSTATTYGERSNGADAHGTTLFGDVKLSAASRCRSMPNRGARDLSF